MNLVELALLTLPAEESVQIVAPTSEQDGSEGEVTLKFL
jgi:hypothetical protein